MRSQSQGRLPVLRENRTAADKGTRAIQTSQVWSNGGKAAAASGPLMIAASHGHNRGNRLLTSTATTSPVFLLFAPAIGIKRVLQIVSVLWIDAKRGALYVFQR